MSIRTNKTFLLVTIVFCLVLKAAMTIHYFNISGDKILQVAAARQMAEGKAYTMPVIKGTEILQQPLILWPPAYSAILSTLIRLTNDTILSTLVLDLATGMLFIILLYLLLASMGFPTMVIALTLLFQSTQINAAITDSASTDLISLNIWLLTVLFLTAHLRSQKVFAFVLFVVFNSIQPWIRYANIPLVVILPVALFAFGTWKKHAAFTKTGLAAFMISICSVAILLFFNYTRSNELFYVLQSDKGFFPGNLLYLPPITLMSFFNIDFLLTQLSLRLHISYSLLYTISRILNFLLLLVAAIYILKLLLPTFTLRTDLSKAGMILMSTALISFASLLVLLMLSISRNRQFNINESWTYIEEQRYMLVITFTIMIFLLYHFLSGHHVKRQGAAKYFGLILMIIMTMETAHGIWIIAKGPYAIQGKNTYLCNLPETKNLIARLQNKSALILADEDYDLRGYGILKGIPIYNDPAEINTSHYSKDHNVLIRIRRGHEALFPNLFQHQHVENLGITEGYQFYSLDPGSDE